MTNPIRPIKFRSNQVVGTLLKRTDWEDTYRIPEAHFMRYSGYARKLSKLRKENPGVIFYGVKIIWTRATPSPGFVQWTIRPYVQGMGCDGTTDGPIHLIAKTFVRQKGGDYKALYKQAYEWKESRGEKASDNEWIDDLEENYAEETHIPAVINPKLMLADLYDINNRSVVEVLSEKYGIDF
jgi:hypothetical protein